VLDAARSLLGAGRVLAAVSGGPDSTALLTALVEARVDVVAAHFDHALRKPARADARWLEALCRRLGVLLMVERRNRPLGAGSIQAAARDLRYEFLERARRRARADVVVVAHTLDDQVETVLLNLLRGTGVSGLGGMADRRGTLARPLLGVRRAEIEEFLAARGLEPLRDPSNLDYRFARVRARAFLLPALERDLPGLRARILAVAKSAAIRRACVDVAAAALAPSREALAQAPEAVRREALRALYTRAAARRPALGRRHLEAMEKVLLGPSGGGVDLPGGWRFDVGSGVVELWRPGSRARLPELRVRECAGCVERGAAHLVAGEPLHVGRRRPGLRMRPAGGAGTRKLQDLLVDARIPRWRRDDLPVVYAGDRLAWIPGVAVSADHASPPGTGGLHVNLEGASESSDNEGAPKRPVLVSTHFSRSFPC
jgi:tRNA(Ile)-lysidine synthetase-like protein